MSAEARRRDDRDRLGRVRVGDGLDVRGELMDVRDDLLEVPLARDLAVVSAASSDRMWALTVLSA